jgi:hypothetical protein
MLAVSNDPSAAQTNIDTGQRHRLVVTGRDDRIFVLKRQVANCIDRRPAPPGKWVDE